MAEKIAVFTVFTFLLFSITTARIAFDPFVVFTNDVSESSPESVAVADSNIVLSGQKPKSEFDLTAANDPLPESDKTQNIGVSTVDSTQFPNFVRFHPIKRHFSDKTTRIPLRFVRRHPCRKFMIPRAKISYGNDMIVADKTDTLDPKVFGDQIQTQWLEFKHNYAHRQHHSRRHGKEGEFDSEKLNSLSHHHKEKKREHEGGFMKRIRKFLKHTFD